MAKRPDRWCKPCTNEYRRDIRQGKIVTNRRIGDSCRGCGADLSDRAKNVIYCGDACRNEAFLATRPQLYTRLWLEKAYGMTLEQKEQMLADQGGRCAICKRSDVAAWHVDHCHDTGRVRGILCPACNLGVGHFADDITRVRSAVRYLKKAAEAQDRS